MSPDSLSLDDLRRRIDELDDALLDILMQRAEVVEAVGALKQATATSPVRPGREAQILRRLLQRHRGPFPKPVLVRLWRELISGMTAVQAELQIAVYSPENAPGFWDIARDHYGSHTPMTAFRSIGEVLRAVGDGRAVLGVLPLPNLPVPGGGEAWWRFLAAGETPVLRIIARLPFNARGNARSEDGGAFVIGPIEPEPSGDDRSLFLIESSDELSRTRLLTVLAGVGLPATVLAAIAPQAGAAAQLVEFDGALTGSDARLKEALTAFGDKVLRIVWVGSYARPLSAADLAVAEPG